jgi:hypothetical protein
MFDVGSWKNEEVSIREFMVCSDLLQLHCRNMLFEVGDYIAGGEFERRKGTNSTVDKGWFREYMRDV